MKRPRILAIIAISAFLACATEVPGIDPPANQIRFPVGLRVHPNDRHLFVVNSNFDLLYNTATVVVVDTTTGQVDPRHTVRVGSFGSEMEMRVSADPNKVRLYVPSRATSTLAVIDADVSATPMLRCTDATTPAGQLPRCDGRYLTAVAVNPFGVLLRPAGEQRVGCSGRVERTREALFLAHVNTSSLGAPEAGVFSVLTAPSGDLPYQIETTFLTPPGANGLAQHPLTSTVYVTTRMDSSIALLRVHTPAPEPGGPDFPILVEQVTRIGVLNPRNGVDSRGIAFNRAGNKAYIANRSTPSVVVFDVSCGPDGRERNRLTRIIDVGADPGAVHYLRRADGRDRIYVPCMNANQIYVIDPVRDEVETIIDVGDGPYGIAFTAGAASGQGLQRAYVTSFREDAISVVELDPTSPNYNREIARLRENTRLLP